MASSQMLLPFLRPMALPRPATLNRFLGISRLSTITPAAEASSLPTPPPARPYLVTKTPSNQYPIYTLKKRGGNMKLTRIRKIEGDLAALKADLTAALKVEEKDVTINQLTRHIIVKVDLSLRGCQT
jgi:large subunit ribosomal protein L49